MSLIKLLQADLYRIRKEKLLLWASLFLMFFGYNLGGQDIAGGVEQIVNRMLSLSFIFIVPCLIHSFYVVWVRDKSTRSVNNILVAGVKRSTYFMSKLLLNIFVFLNYYLAMIVPMLVRMFLRSLEFTNIGLMAKSIFAQVPFYITLVIIGSVLFVVVNKSHIATIAYLMGMFMGERLLSIIVNNINPDWLFIEKYYIYSNMRSVMMPEFYKAANLCNAYIPCIALSIIASIIGLNYFRRKDFD